MFPTRTIVYPTKPLVLGVRKPFELLVRGLQESSPTMLATAIVFCCFPEFEEEVLLLKTPHTST